MVADASAGLAPASGHREDRPVASRSWSCLHGDQVALALASLLMVTPGNGGLLSQASYWPVILILDP